MDKILRQMLTEKPHATLKIINELKFIDGDDIKKIESYFSQQGVSCNVVDGFIRLGPL